MRIGFAATLLCTTLGPLSPLAAQSERVIVDNDGWALVGDLVVPDADGARPAVLMLNQAAGSRGAYARLAAALEDRGFVSLRLDLRGHGESTNLGSFVPGERSPDPLIWGAETDVAAALRFLSAHPAVDAGRVAVVAASYSGEKAAESGRLHGFASAYVLLSPGSLGQPSIDAMDDSGAAWLVISAERDPHLTEIMATVAARSRMAETELLPGDAHATDLLEARPTLGTRIGDWLVARLAAGR